MGPKIYRSALAVSNAGTACRWVRNAQVVITKAVWMHFHSEPSTALSIDFGRVRATATPASAAITNVSASTFSLSWEKVMALFRVVWNVPRFDNGCVRGRAGSRVTDCSEYGL